MKNLLWFLMLLFVMGCSSPTNHHANDSTQQTNETDTLENSQSMQGRLVASFERLEFDYQGKTYYLIDSHALLDDIISKQRLTNEKFYINQDLCITGDVLYKHHNQSRGFGHMEQYDQAISIKSIC